MTDWRIILWRLTPTWLLRLPERLRDLRFRLYVWRHSPVKDAPLTAEHALLLMVAEMVIEDVENS